MKIGIASRASVKVMGKNIKVMMRRRYKGLE